MPLNSPDMPFNSPDMPWDIPDMLSNAPDMRSNAPDMPLNSPDMSGKAECIPGAFPARPKSAVLSLKAAEAAEAAVLWDGEVHCYGFHVQCSVCDGHAPRRSVNENAPSA